MKVKLKAFLPGYTGNMDDVVIYYNAHLNMMIARRKVIPKVTPSNQEMKTAFAFARKIRLSEDYKQDAAIYIKLYNRKFRRNNRAHSSWPSIWTKLMRAMMKDHPELDFEALSREDAIAANLPCITVAAAVQAGYLPSVPGYEILTAMI